jgi:hypothetical protein
MAHTASRKRRCEYRHAPVGTRPGRSSLSEVFGHCLRRGTGVGHRLAQQMLRDAEPLLPVIDLDRLVDVDVRRRT